MKKYIITLLFFIFIFNILSSVSYGANNPIRISNQKDVTITNETFSLTYDKNGGKYENSFIVIRNCENVIIDNIEIIQNNPDFLATYSIIIEDCKKVTIRNSTFKGTCLYHIRIEGCEEILIENVTITGLDYGDKGIRSGGGIWINNGATSSTDDGLWSRNPLNLLNLVIRDCKISNNFASDKNRNLDGILIHSASNGTISNCIFENWLAGDAALDISHRRTDNDYTNKHFTIKNCIFKNNKHVKAVGRSNQSNSIQWENNLYIDTIIGNYHIGWKDQRIFESYLFTKPTFGFWRNWERQKGKVGIHGGLLHVEKGTLSDIYKLSYKAGDDALNYLHMDHNIYSFQDEPNRFLSKQFYNKPHTFPLYNDWASWQSEKRDNNSKFLIESSSISVLSQNGYRYPVYTGSINNENIVLPVKRQPATDFLGIPRSKFCYGAVCPTSINLMPPVIFIHDNAEK